MLKLYDYPDCPFCQKVRVVLAEKDLEYEKVFVDLRKQEQKTPEFLRMNPYGKVPVLVDEDEVIYDSTIINEYLEDEYPLPRLMPEDSQARAQVRSSRTTATTRSSRPPRMLLAQLRKPRGGARWTARRAGPRGAPAVPLLPARQARRRASTWSATSSRSPMPRSRRA